MKYKKPITVLTMLIAVVAAGAAAAGIFSRGGQGLHEYQSIRGRTVLVYGQGIYQHMSAEVAPQGIAQDYVTLFVAVPALVFFLFLARTGSLRGRFLLAGTLGYFLVTYLFYLMIAMYNVFFLGYVALLGASFFAFFLTMRSFDLENLPHRFGASTPVGFAGGFLIFNAVVIAALWLSIVIPPLLDGTIIPPQVEHYTTLVVQGLDLALFLPIAFVAGLQFIRKKPFGYLLAPTYLVLLSLLMLALTAKLIGMASLGHNVIPAIVIIPVFALVAITSTVLIVRNMKKSEIERH